MRGVMLPYPPRSTHEYVGFWRDCDCIVAVCVDLTDYPKDTADSVADFIKSGYRVQRFTHAEFKELEWRCEDHPKGSPAPWEHKPETLGL